MPLYVFWLTKGLLSSYTTGGGWGIIWIAYIVGRGGVTPHVYVLTYTVSLHVFGRIGHNKTKTS